MTLKKINSATIICMRKIHAKVENNFTIQVTINIFYRMVIIHFVRTRSSEKNLLKYSLIILIFITMCQVEKYTNL